jgi:hypothetical protein
VCLYLATVLQQVVASMRPQELVDAVFACFAYNFSLIEQPSPCMHYMLRERASASIRRPSLSCHHTQPILLLWVGVTPLQHGVASSRTREGAVVLLECDPRRQACTTETAFAIAAAAAVSHKLQSKLRNTGVLQVLVFCCSKTSLTQLKSC